VQIRNSPIDQPVGKEYSNDMLQHTPCFEFTWCYCATHTHTHTHTHMHSHTLTHTHNRMCGAVCVLCLLLSLVVYSEEKKDTFLCQSVFSCNLSSGVSLKRMYSTQRNLFIILSVRNKKCQHTNVCDFFCCLLSPTSLLLDYLWGCAHIPKYRTVRWGETWFILIILGPRV
jgi:hypothetical protein